MPNSLSGYTVILPDGQQFYPQTYSFDEIYLHDFSSNVNVARCRFCSHTGNEHTTTRIIHPEFSPVFYQAICNCGQCEVWIWLHNNNNNGSGDMKYIHFNPNTVGRPRILSNMFVLSHKTYLEYGIDPIKYKERSTKTENYFPLIVSDKPYVPPPRPRPSQEDLQAIIDSQKNQIESLKSLVRILRKGSCDPDAPCDRIEDDEPGTYVCGYHE